MPGTLLLTRSDVRQVAEWPVLIDAVRDALLLRQAGDAAVPVSGQLTLPAALLHLKAGAFSAPGTMSVKANLRPHDGGVRGLVVLFEPEAGRIAAVLDSADVTAMRTAALATLAAETLAVQEADSLAVLGAGPLARAVLAVLTARLRLTRVHVWSRSRDAAEAMARSTELPVDVHASPGDAARGAAIVATATPARSPFLESGDLADGSLILAMGADSPGKRELGASVLEDACIVADQREDVLRVGESAYLPVDARSRIVAELGELLAGTISIPAPGSPRAGRITVFDSVGSAVVDAMVCRSIVARATELGLGRPFDFSR